MKDDSGLLCQTCWTRTREWLGEERAEGRCGVCGEPVEHRRSLHVHRTGDPAGWQLCPAHAVEFLNRLRTVEPKLEVETFTLAGDWSERRRVAVEYLPDTTSRPAAEAVDLTESGRPFDHPAE